MGTNNNARGAQNQIHFKRYSRLTAQIIKNSVKKKIYDIRKRGDTAVDELLDTLQEKLEKNILSKGGSLNGRRDLNEAGIDDRSKPHGAPSEAVYNEIAATLAEGIALFDRLKSGSGPSASTISFEEMLLGVIKANRAAWLRFIKELANGCDAESLATFGTDLIYGGYMTETLNDSSKCSYFDLSEGALSNRRLESIKNNLKKDVSEGRRVCLIRGSELLNIELLKIYRYFSDTAFILADLSSCEPQSPLTSLGIYNVMVIPSSSKPLSSKKVPLSGVLALSGDRNTPISDTCGGNNGYTSITEKGSGAKLSYGGVSTSRGGISRLFYFISSPSLPINVTFDDIYTLICELESVLSGNRNREPIKYHS